MPRPLGARLAILALVLSASGAAAQFNTMFGDPPRPPGSVPSRQAPARPPPAGRYVPPEQYPQGRYAPEPTPPGEYVAPMEQNPPPGAAAPSRGAASGVETQPLPPPPGGAADPGRTPSGPASPRPASLPPGPGSPPGAAAPGSGAPGAPGAPAPAYEEVVTEMPSQKIPNPTAIFSGLDKITGRITTFDVAVNETVQFGALRVRPRACYTRPPTEAPSTTGFVEVDEVTLQGEVKRLFRGWMFAASPGLHGVEHSIYDVWLADCKGAATAAVEEPPPAPEPAKPASQPQRQPRQPATQQQRTQQPQQRQSAGTPSAPRQRAPAPAATPQ